MQKKEVFCSHGKFTRKKRRILSRFCDFLLTFLCGGLIIERTSSKKQ